MGVVELKLNNGTVFTYRREKIAQMEFQEMTINNITDFNLKPYKNTIEYVKYILDNKKKRLKVIRNSLLAFFPILSSIFILTIGIQQLRHGRNWANILIGFVIIFYYASIFILIKYFDYKTFAFIPIWIILAYIIYYFKVVRRF
jgi:lipopolysaccharide export LptBFGC system permease protein LptF